MKIKAWADKAMEKAADIYAAIQSCMDKEAVIVLAEVDGEKVAACPEQDRLWVRVPAPVAGAEACEGCPLAGHCRALNFCVGFNHGETWREVDAIVVRNGGRRTVVTGATAEALENPSCWKAHSILGVTVLTKDGSEGIWYPSETGYPLPKGVREVAGKISARWAHTLQGHVGTVAVSAPDGHLLVSDAEIQVQTQDLYDAALQALGLTVDGGDPEPAPEPAEFTDAAPEVPAPTPAPTPEPTHEPAPAPEASDAVIDVPAKAYRYRGVNIVTVPWSAGLYVATPSEGDGCESCAFKSTCFTRSAPFDCNALLDAHCCWRREESLVITGGPAFKAPNGFLEVVNDAAVDPSVLEPLTEEEIQKLAVDGRIDRAESEPLPVIVEKEGSPAAEQGPVVYNINNRAYLVAEGRLFQRVAAEDSNCAGCQLEHCNLRGFTTRLLWPHCKNAANQRRVWHECQLVGTEQGASWYKAKGHNFVLQQDGTLLFYKNGYTHRSEGYSLAGYVKLKRS